MNENTAARIAPTRTVVNHGPILLFGLSQHYHRSNAGIPQQWDRFAPYLGQIPYQVGQVTYGVIYNADAAGGWDYLCGVEVSEFPDQPAGLTRLRIPPQSYAVFTH